MEDNLEVTVKSQELNSEIDNWQLWRKRPQILKEPSVITTQHPLDEFYKLNHEYRGIALILNHKYFDNVSNKTRTGTEFDMFAMKETFEELQFQVQVYNDLSRMEVLKLFKYVSQMDHSRCDCLVVVVMTHGKSNGRIFARDHDYSTNEMVGFFSGTRCPSLAGKPKLFFIQACRGETTDSGVKMTYVESDANEALVYTIPVMADILMMYATAEGFYAWRDTKKGSCFIQSLAEQLKRHHRERDLLSILTLVNRQVAIGFSSKTLDPKMNNKKEMCSIVSMLTRLLYFP
ncbi:caspase-1-like [Cylas formicarius]|uniref:caspase-1-like n=1 Tax=Cylas formicarius TaxID=197179 RepID=UPI0029587A5C|nr:caspase-1-like [Cylas formicarius]